MNNNIILAGNGPYKNRGCQAIVSGTIKILNKFFDKQEYVIESFFESDLQYFEQLYEEKNKNITHIKYNKIKKLPLIEKIKLKYPIFNFIKNNKFKFLQHNELLKYIDKSDFILSIGGDNYTLDYDYPKPFTDLDDIALYYKKPIIIWGASIGPFSKNISYEKYIINHLKKIDGIFVREQNSFEYLNNSGLKNIFKFPDPAFIIESVKPPDFYKLKNLNGSIGINLSPIMSKYITENNLIKWLQFCIEFIYQLFIKFKKTIYLIPHVFTNQNNDYVFLKIIKNIIDSDNKYNNLKNYVYILNKEYSCEELKYIISKLTCFVGCRTHSTIASYSSSVPTLSFSYSQKSTGIAKEIYNNDYFSINPLNYKIGEILDRIEELINNKEIKIKIKKSMEKIIIDCYKSGEKLKQLI